MHLDSVQSGEHLLPAGAEPALYVEEVQRNHLSGGNQLRSEKAVKNKAMGVVAKMRKEMRVRKMLKGQGAQGRRMPSQKMAAGKRKRNRTTKMRKRMTRKMRRRMRRKGTRRRFLHREGAEEEEVVEIAVVELAKQKLQRKGELGKQLIPSEGVQERSNLNSFIAHHIYGQILLI